MPSDPTEQDEQHVAYVTPRLIEWTRQRLSLSVQAAAHEVGVSPTTWQAWEAGTSHPTLAQAQTLAQRLRVPFGMLYLSSPPALCAPTEQDWCDPDDDLRDCLDRTQAKLVQACERADAAEATVAEWERTNAESQRLHAETMARLSDQRDQADARATETMRWLKTMERDRDQAVVDAEVAQKERSAAEARAARIEAEAAAHKQALVEAAIVLEALLAVEQANQHSKYQPFASGTLAQIHRAVEAIRLATATDAGAALLARLAALEARNALLERVAETSRAYLVFSTRLRYLPAINLSREAVLEREKADKVAEPNTLRWRAGYALADAFDALAALEATQAGEQEGQP